MTAGGINSFAINRIFSENNILAESRKNLYRGALGLSGKIAGDWTYDSYVTFGRSDNYIANPNTLDYNHYYAAVDAVVDPASGNVVCRSTLSGLTPGCVPINLFGAGSPSAASLNYIEQTEWRDLILEQTVASASVQGKLFSLNDRPVQLAAGAEWRHETSDQTVSANSTEIVDFTGIRGGAASVKGQKGPFIVGNPQPLSGGYSVKEAFAELAVPLLHDLPGANLLDSDFAARYTDYSLSGGVTTWKASANWKPFQDLRFRATRSRDIRAPNTAELFTGASQGIGTARNPQTGQTVDVITITSGNPKLDPEIADTLTYGVVYQPSFLDGLSISIDHYSIKINGAIATLGRQQVFDQCYGGNPSACSYIQLDGTQYRLALPYLNINELEVAGDDIEASYVHRVGPGRLSARVLANYQPTYQTTTPGGVVDDIAGETGLTDNPRWRGSVSVNYDLGPVSAFVQERYIDHGIYDHTLVAGTTVNENSVHQVFYTDLTAKYRFGSAGQVEAFLTVNNLFNRAPPFAPNISGTHASWSNFDLYDTIGRYFTLGARVNF
jgi:outer membrane receptor protein involved in Fe transport